MSESRFLDDLLECVPQCGRAGALRPSAAGRPVARDRRPFHDRPVRSYYLKTSMMLEDCLTDGPGPAVVLPDRA